jgi:hypothetical protein
VARSWASERTWEQRFAESHLAPHPHRLEIRGWPRSQSWPDVCANCGAPAGERLRLRKAYFYRAPRRPVMDFPGYRVVVADVPYCAACAARHRETLPQAGFVRRYGTFLFNPAHIATVGFAVLLVLVGPSLVAGVIRSPADKVGWSFLGVLVFGLVWTPAIVWWMTRPNRFEPRTEITQACDISPDVSLFYEQRRYIYAFRNQAFAEAFARANAARVWTAQDQARMQWTWGIVAGVLLVALVAARVVMWYVTGK